jgi:anti-anti-sigma factor
VTPKISRLALSVQSQFRVEVRSEGRSAVVAVSGELDLASGPELEQVLERFTGTPTELLVIDLREVDFMDSTGLSIIVKAHQRFADDGRQLGLVRGSSQVQRLLDLTGVAERLPLVDTPEELLDGD